MKKLSKILFEITINYTEEQESRPDLHIVQGDVVDECDDGFMVRMHDWTI